MTFCLVCSSGGSHNGRRGMPACVICTLAMPLYLQASKKANVLSHGTKRVSIVSKTFLTFLMTVVRALPSMSLLGILEIAKSLPSASFLWRLPQRRVRSCSVGLFFMLKAATLIAFRCTHGCTLKRLSPFQICSTPWCICLRQVLNGMSNRYVDPFAEGTRSMPKVKCAITRRPWSCRRGKPETCEQIRWKLSWETG